MDNIFTIVVTKYNSPEIPVGIYHNNTIEGMGLLSNVTPLKCRRYGQEFYIYVSYDRESLTKVPNFFRSSDRIVPLMEALEKTGTEVC